MDIICAKCGRHFSSVEAAREHRGHCKETGINEEIHWLPAKKSTQNKWVPVKRSDLTQSELEKLRELEEFFRKKPSPEEPDIDLPAEKLASETSDTNHIPEGHVSAHPKAEYTTENPDLEFPIEESDKRKSTNVKRKKASNSLRKIFNNKVWATNYRINNWFLALLLIFALSIVGFGISIFINNTVPFWLLAGFSIVFSVEYWFYYQTRKHVYIGRIYKLLLNLSLLILLGHIVWSGIQLFSEQLTQTPLIGSIVFISELIAFIWLLRVLNRNRRRWPSMKLTVFSLICLLVIFAFAGVSPFNSYKDIITNGVSRWYSSLEFNNSTAEPDSDPTNTTITAVTPDKEELQGDTDISNTKFVLPFFTNDGEYKNYYFGLVRTSDGVLNGNNCYGEFITLLNNQEAKNPTYSELLAFLKSDKTDEFPYRYTPFVLGFYYGEAEDKIDIERIKNIIDGVVDPENPKVCADFAERLHNNAELAGIRCGYVSLDITNYSDPNGLGIESDAGHACNVFETTDRGLVYIDCTGIMGDYGPPNNDMIVEIQLENEYNPQFLFPSEGWYVPSGQMGEVTDMFVTWDGEWR
ncbi:hypothetical protein ACFLYN_02085 [Chloroflexota bacterium]